jgi:hypothetical protein
MRLALLGRSARFSAKLPWDFSVATPVEAGFFRRTHGQVIRYIVAMWIYMAYIFLLKDQCDAEISESFFFLLVVV